MESQMNDYRLYILMRNDMPSMNPGKACAQAAHAANQFIHTSKLFKDPVARAAVGAWEVSANGFGTTIVLSGNGDEIKQAVELAVGRNLLAGETWDPTYPFFDGPTLLLTNVMTCAFIFATKEQAADILINFPLMNQIKSGDTVKFVEKQRELGYDVTRLDKKK